MSHGKATHSGSAASPQEPRRSYHKMVSDPGRETPDFPLPAPSPLQHTTIQHLNAASPQPHQQLQPVLGNIAVGLGDSNGKSKLHAEPSIQLVGVEEFENVIVHKRRGDGHSPALSSEESALKAVLAELHLRSASVSPT